MDLSIIVVTYNAAQFVRKCFESIGSGVDVLAQNQYESEVIVIDNHSTDGSADLVAAVFPDASLIRNSANVGFAAANNQGIQHADGRYILLLNPDTELGPDTLLGALRFMDAQPSDVGMMGCKILNPDGSIQASCYVKPSIITEVGYRLGISHFIPIPGLTTNEIPPSSFYDDVQDVDSVLGAFLLVRKEVTDSVGLLDESTFFMYGEELDWAIRSRNANWRVVYLPSVSIIHYGRQRSALRSLQQDMELYKSRFRLFSKHYGPVYAFLVRVAAGMGLVLKMGFSLMQLVVPSKREGALGRLIRSLSLFVWNGRTLLSPASEL